MTGDVEGPVSAERRRGIFRKKLDGAIFKGKQYLHRYDPRMYVCM